MDRTNDWHIRSDSFWVCDPDTQMGRYWLYSPLLAWTGTRLEGLTERAILLEGFFSQTYSSKRNNIRECLIFDPWLEPEIAASILQEFESRHIRYNQCSDVLGLIGFAGEIRFQEPPR